MEATKQWLSNYFPCYTLNVSGGVVNPTERLPVAQTVFLSLQHVLAMFGSTVVGPLLMGFNPNTALFFSGIGTILFFICTGGRVPSYVGSSFAFIGVVNSATGFKYVPGGPGNPNAPLASGGILVAGAIYFAVALIVMLAGHRWIEYIMPPVVTGAVVVAIGLNLAGAALAQASASGFDAWMSFTTVIAVALITMYAPGPLRRLPILLGGITGYLVHLILGYCGVGPGIDFTAVKNSKWFGMPPTHAPVFEGSAISLIAPVAVVLIVENTGHVKAVGAMTGHSLDKYMGRAFLGDAIATMVSAACGSTGVTTYAENIGVMSVTKIFSTQTFLFAAVVAIILGVIPGFGAIIQTIPSGVFGGLSIILFGLIAVTGARIWVMSNVDFSRPRNLITAGVSVVLGCGMVNGLVVSFGVVKIDGIGCSTLSAIILYQILREDWGDIFRSLVGKFKKGKGANPVMMVADSPKGDLDLPISTSRRDSSDAEEMELERRSSIDIKRTQ
ncbi:hypothetical protein KI688_006610 [Linnemannia hyalina]|uniref:Uracil permease n=1 Tax=Linnemannia hyalina TaxID=64524 RepID=A0A9P7XLG2_9FUNG|nr:hypothetical protein KI688_006610 [Linnemannia hyalina]